MEDVKMVEQPHAEASNATRAAQAQDVRKKEEHDAFLVGLYRSCLDDGSSKLYVRMVNQYPGAGMMTEGGRRAEHKKLANLFGHSGRLNSTATKKEWTASEDRRLRTLIKGVEEPFPFASWASQFNTRSANDLRDHARSIAKEYCKQRRQCAFDHANDTRCINRQGEIEGLTFQAVPDVAALHTMMAIRSGQWCKSMVVCSDHGHDLTLPLSRSNYPHRPSERCTAHRKRQRAVRHPEAVTPNNRDTKRAALAEKHK